MRDFMMFEFEGAVYIVPTDSMNYAGDVVQLPDGRFLEIRTLETHPPQVDWVTIVDGPHDVPDPSGRGMHKGVAWPATACLTNETWIWTANNRMQDLIAMRGTDLTAYICTGCGEIQTGSGFKTAVGQACSTKCFIIAGYFQR